MVAHERDYLERTIATVRNHRDADNCWPQWANIFADEIERLWALLGPGYHVAEVWRDDAGGFEWRLQHPISCRPKLLDCMVHDALASLKVDRWPRKPGNYRVDVSGLTFPDVTFELLEAVG